MYKKKQYCSKLFFLPVFFEFNLTLINYLDLVIVWPNLFQNELFRPY